MTTQRSATRRAVPTAQRSGFRALKVTVSAWIASSVAASSLPAEVVGPEIDVQYVSGRGTSARIVNGLPTVWYPSVGELLHRNGGSFDSLCTATLIGCSTVLTAAHCIARDGDVRNYRMFFQHGGLVNISSIVWQKEDYRDPTMNGEKADIAVIGLAEQISGISPHPINQESEHMPNVPGIIVGFGRTGGSATDYGLKRLGLVKSTDCGAGFAENEMVCWDFNGSGSNTCSGDSGGPLLLSESRGPEVISGVTSGGRNGSCLTSDHSFDTSVFRYKDWVKAAAGADLGAKACGPVAPLAAKLEDNDKRFKAASGQLSSDSPQHAFEVRVKRAHVLRVGVNVAKFLGADVDEKAASPRILIAKGQARDGTNALCTTDTVGAAAFCSVPNPVDGDVYTILLDRVGNQLRADFQMVVSAF